MILYNNFPNLISETHSLSLVWSLSILCIREKGTPQGDVGRKNPVDPEIRSELQRPRFENVALCEANISIKRKEDWKCLFSNNICLLGIGVSRLEIPIYNKKLK